MNVAEGIILNQDLPDWLMIHLRELDSHLLNAPKISDRDEEILNLSLKQIKSLIWVRITQLNQLKLFALAEVEG